MTTAPPVHANGAAIPAIGLGTWRLAGDEGAEAVRSALAAGYRHIDTAAMYDNEEAVGAGLKASGVKRDEVFVTTKVWPEDLAPGDLERSAEASLKRLRLDAVDLLLIHWPNAAIPLRGSIEALCRVRRAGLARHIGVANFTVALLDEAVALAGEPLVTNQCEYHPYLEPGAGAGGLPPARPRLHVVFTPRPRRARVGAGRRRHRRPARQDAGAGRAALARAAARRRRHSQIRQPPPHRREPRRLRFHADRRRHAPYLVPRATGRAHGHARLVAAMGRRRVTHLPLEGGGRRRRRRVGVTPLQDRTEAVSPLPAAPRCPRGPSTLPLQGRVVSGRARS